MNVCCCCSLIFLLVTTGTVTGILVAWIDGSDDDDKFGRKTNVGVSGGI